jgi:hypothetical protein
MYEMHFAHSGGTCGDSIVTSAVLQMLLNIPAAEVASRLEALGTALGITHDEVVLLVREEPRFLLFSKGVYVQGWEELQQTCCESAEWRQQIKSWTAATLYRCATTHVPFSIVK